MVSESGNRYSDMKCASGQTRTRRSIAALGACALAVSMSVARAQSIEPRSFSPAPVDVNFLIVGYAATSGGLSFDPSAPIADPKITTAGPVLAYARTLGLWGASGKFDAILPIARLSGSALYQGAPVSREVVGLEDPLFRLSVGLFGAPAMKMAQFRSFKQDLVIGASLQVSVPLGQYDRTRLVNLSAHRWYFKPELGVSKAIGPWSLELSGAITVYTSNSEFFGSNERSQAPLYSTQSHVIYNFKSGIWVSLDGAFYAGGRSTLNGDLSNDLQSNWRAGATLALPVTQRNSIKLFGSSGVSARTGNNFDLVGVAWQYRWGGGL